MITKTITYEDFEGNQVTKKFAFHLTKADFMELEATVGDLQHELSIAQEANDVRRIIDLIRNIVRIAYGERTPDDRFIKFGKDGHRLGDDFVVTEAYSELLTEFTTIETALGDFVKGVLPAGVMKQLKEKVNEHPEEYPEEMQTLINN